MENLQANPQAEKVLNTVASITLAFGIIVFIACFIISMIQFDDYEPEAGWIFLGVGLLILLAQIVTWAVLRVFINISLNLYPQENSKVTPAQNIVANNNSFKQTESVPQSQKADLTDDLFSVGQIVVRMSDGVRIKVSDVIKKEDGTYYRCSKLDSLIIAGTYSADELAAI